MRFSSTTESLGVSLLDAIMTLIAFLPVLVRLSADITEVPLLGAIPHPLVVAALLWSALRHRLPRARRHQAARASSSATSASRPPTARSSSTARTTPPAPTRRPSRELFANVRRNYFRLYFHYMYFNVARIFYLQIDNVFGYVILAPAIVAGAITLGLMNQILNALDQVRSSFQYLVNSWTTVVELLSIYKRLRAFEATIHGEPLPSIEHQPLPYGEPQPAS